jgi:outer membrane immunogenic protein
MNLLQRGAPVLAAGLVILAGVAQAQTVGQGHIEVQGGWDHFNVPDQTGATSGVSTGRNRGLYGFGAGYDVTTGGHYVFGVDTNIDFAGGGNCLGSVLASGDQLCGRYRHDWDIGGRVGYRAGRTLLYGRLAYDQTSVSSTYLPATGTASRAITDVSGVRLGAGLEYNLTKRFYAKTEYRFTPDERFGDEHQLMFGVGLHF